MNGHDWKVRKTHTDLLENVLNELTEEGYEIHSIFTVNAYDPFVVVARKPR